ncbi:MAG: hypothetical protein D3923_01035 [Candidatus Electrothrix sp. AR3]|nr:hypothetical protein [Candidatus Electrothrix sp. AR3]
MRERKSGDNYEHVYRMLKKSGFIIYAGQSEMKNKIFRIANRGDISLSDIESLLYCFASCFNLKHRLT